MERLKKISVLALLLLFALNSVTASADTGAELNEVCAGLAEAAPYPEVSSIGGEWSVIALARAGYDAPAGYYNEYYKKAEEFLKSASTRRYTDYSRVLLALTAIGADTNGAEERLDDFDAVTRQGINGAVFALIALDCGGYECSRRGEYLEFILNRQHSDGGFGLGDESDVDVTAMTLQALAPYADRDDIRAAADNAIAYLDAAPVTTCESAAQCVIAYCALSAPPYGYDGDAMYGYYDELMNYYAGGGRFEHEIGGGADLMASEQAACALAALWRSEHNMPPIYDMKDVKPLIVTGGEFYDVKAEDKEYVRYLTENNIFNGRTETVFEPDGRMTRAELAAVAVRALYREAGEVSSSENYFDDVDNDAWYRWYVNTAAENGIVSGVGEGIFDPDGYVTREQAVVMLIRVAGAIGRPAECAESGLNETAVEFGDFGAVSDWARESVAAASKYGYLDKSLYIEPGGDITRIETARIIARILRYGEV